MAVLDLSNIPPGNQISPSTLFHPFTFDTSDPGLRSFAQIFYFPPPMPIPKPLIVPPPPFFPAPQLIQVWPFIDPVTGMSAIDPVTGLAVTTRTINVNMPFMPAPAGKTYHFFYWADNDINRFANGMGLAHVMIGCDIFVVPPPPAPPTGHPNGQVVKYFPEV